MNLTLKDLMEFVEDYVLRGTSYGDQADKHGVCKSTAWNWLKRCFELLKNPFKVFEPDVSDTVVSDDTGARLNGEKALIWGTICPYTRISLSERVSWTRNDIVVENILSETVKNSKNIDGLIKWTVPTFRAYLKSCGAGFGRSAEGTKPDTLC